MEPHENLETFRDWFLQQPVESLRILECRNYGKIVASVVYRKPPYQVELVIGEPNAKIPAHRHPNIEAYEVHISGDLRLIYDLPQETVSALLEKARPFPERFARGKVIHIKPDSWHAAIAGPTGASFWSVQKWVGDIEITAAGENWEGEVFSDKQVIAGAA